jgi:hypothetical protein
MFARSSTLTCAYAVIVLSLASSAGTAYATGSGDVGRDDLTDAEVEDLLRRSYQYVAMYNVNNKFAVKTGGWNRFSADTELKDHTMREIARPNNDTPSRARIWP